MIESYNTEVVDTDMFSCVITFPNDKPPVVAIPNGYTAISIDTQSKVNVFLEGDWLYVPTYPICCIINKDMYNTLVSYAKNHYFKNRGVYLVQCLQGVGLIMFVTGKINA